MSVSPCRRMQQVEISNIHQDVEKRQYNREDAFASTGMFLSVGTVIDDKYEIRQTVGSGGMGVVYEAYHREMERSVALKLLTSDPDDESRERQRFLREASVLSRLSHKNIVAFYAYGVWRGQPYIVMERLVGPSLQQVISRRYGPINSDLALAVALQVCHALHHAHAEGIYHRDIKPSNIILSGSSGEHYPEANDDLHVKLIDFGLAKSVNIQDQQKLTRTNQALGSVNYMSPEQCISHPVDARSDIYSVGCVLYECFTGDPPFRADNAVAMMFQHLNESVTDAPQWSTVPPEMQKVIRKCMAKQPGKRYQAASLLAEDLELIRAGSTVAAGDMDFSNQNRMRITGGESVEEFRRFLSGGTAHVGRNNPIKALAPWAVITGIVLLGVGAVFLAPRWHTQILDAAANMGSNEVSSSEVKHAYPDARIALLVATSHQNAGRDEEAFKALTEADALLATQSPAPDASTTICVKMMLGNYATLREDHKRAQTYFRDALKVAAVAPPQKRAEIYLACGTNAWHLREFADAVKFCTEALAIEEQVAKSAEGGLQREAAHGTCASICQILADGYDGIGEQKLAEAAYDRAVAHAFSQDMLTNRMIALRRYAAYLTSKGKVHEAVTIMDKWSQAEAELVYNAEAAVKQERAEGHALRAALHAHLGDHAGIDRELVATLDWVVKAGADRTKDALRFSLCSEANHFYKEDNVAVADKFADAGKKCWTKNDERELLVHNNELQRKDALLRISAKKEVRSDSSGTKSPPETTIK